MNAVSTCAKTGRVCGLPGRSELGKPVTEMGHLQLKLENELRFSLLVFSYSTGFRQAFGVAVSLGPDSKSTRLP